MITVYHIADTHIKLGPRWNECKRVLSAFAERVEQDGPDVVVHAGDVFDAKSQPEEMQFAERWFQRLANVCHVIVVPGNHDVALEIEALGRLEAEYEIHTVMTPRICDFVLCGLSIACLPWPSKAGVITQAESLSLDGVNEDASGHLRAILRHLGSQLRECGQPATMLLAHAMVRGSKTAAGQPLVGCDFELGLDDLDMVGAQAVALGHIHKSQGWQQPGSIVRYCGSPFHTDFGDWFEKSFARWRFENGEVAMDRIHLPAHQMLDVVCAYDPEIGISPDFALTNAGEYEVRLRYSYEPEHAKAARAAAELWKSEQEALGAYSVQLDPQVIVTTRARAPEVATAVSDDEKLCAYWASKGEDANDSEHAGLLAKFHEVQL